MFTDIDKRLKIVAEIVLVICFCVGTIWFCLTAPETTSMIYSAAFIFVGFVISYLIYGFGEVITLLRKISDKSDDGDAEKIEDIEK